MSATLLRRIFLKKKHILEEYTTNGMHNNDQESETQLERAVHPVENFSIVYFFLLSFFFPCCWIYLMGLFFSMT
jgi:hypothetical protein